MKLIMCVLFSASRIRYEITSGNIGGAFAVKNMTGAIYVAGALDYETRKRVSLDYWHTFHFSFRSCLGCSGLRDKEEGESRLLAHIPLQFPQLSRGGKERMPRQTLPDVMCSWLEVPCKCSPLNYLTTAKIVNTCCAT